MQLTANAVENFNKNGGGMQTHNPPLVLKLIGRRKVERDEKDKSKAVRYRVILSDGEKSIQGLVLPKLQHLFEDDRIPDQSILKITQVGVSRNEKASFLLLHDFTVVQPNDAQEVAPTASSDPQFTAPSTSGNQDFNQLQNQPPPVQSDPNAPITVPIASINPYQTNWTILGRVSQKSDIKNYTNAKGTGKLFNFNIIDQSGEIRATCFNEQVDQFYDLIQTNKVYYLTQAKVNTARKEFSNLDHNYELMLGGNTNIVPSQANTSNIPKNHYSFKKLSEIEEIETNSYIDVIAVVKDVFDLTSINTKNGSTISKRDLMLVDDSKKTIRLTLWGNNAESIKIDGNPIIACKGLRIGEFQGKTLSASHGSTIDINPEIEESYALRGWFDANGHKENFDSFSTSTPMVNSGKSKVSDISSIKDQQPEQNDKPLYFNIIASIIHIRTNTMYYPACGSDSCNKKVIARENDWFCETCSRSFSHPKYRYTLSANVADHTGQLWVSIFDACGNEILQKSADQLQSISESDPEQVKEYLSVASNRQLVFKCTARNEVYNDQSRVKYTVIAVSPVDYSAQSELILSELSHL